RDFDFFGWEPVPAVDRQLLLTKSLSPDRQGALQTSLLDLDSGKFLSQPIRIDTRDVGTVPLLTPDHGRVVVAGLDTTLRVWNLATGQIQAVMRLSGAPETWSCSPDGLHVVAVTRDHSVRVWRTESGQPLTPLLKHDQPVDSAAF